MHGLLGLRISRGIGEPLKTGPLGGTCKGSGDLVEIVESALLLALSIVSCNLMAVMDHHHSLAQIVGGGTSQVLADGSGKAVSLLFASL